MQSYCMTTSHQKSAFLVVAKLFDSVFFQYAGTTCGYFWNELLKSLVTITNSCDRAGTIASELPIVEQIPVSIILQTISLLLYTNVDCYVVERMRVSGV
jgi:hypothetical protein